MELEQVPLLFSRLPMFPFFDLAHYMASIMALKEQRGERRGERGGSRCAPAWERRPTAVCVAHVGTTLQPLLALFQHIAFTVTVIPRSPFSLS